MTDGIADGPPAGVGALLRTGLLDGVRIVVAGAADPFVRVADAVETVATDLGASVSRLRAEADEPAPTALFGDASVLVCDGAGLLAQAMSGVTSLAGTGDALSTAMAGVWNAIRVVAVPAFVEAARPGRVIAIAPAAGVAPVADGARAALENLARTLSVEWARRAVTTVSIAPGAATSDEQVATVVAYLASPAGAYYSGCQLDLRGALS